MRHVHPVHRGAIVTGRPTSLTPEVEKRVLEAIKAGNYKATACKLAGIHRDTLNGWELRGKTGEEPYASFSDALQTAEAEAESGLLQQIMTAAPAVVGISGPDMWQRLAWIMERRWPQRWSGRVRLQVSEELGAFTAKVRAALDDDTYRKVVDATREDAAGSAADGDSRH